MPKPKIKSNILEVEHLNHFQKESDGKQRTADKLLNVLEIESVNDDLDFHYKEKKKRASEYSILLSKLALCHWTITPRI